MKNVVYYTRELHYEIIVFWYIINKLLFYIIKRNESEYV